MIILFLIGCTANDEQPSENETNENTSEEEEALPIEGLEVVAENLDVPWSIEKLEDTFYLTERSGSENTWAPSGMTYTDEKLYVAALRGTAVLEFNLETIEKIKFRTQVVKYV